MKKKRLEHINQEILHSQKIFDRAEFVWGWSTSAGQKRAERRGDIFIRLGKLKKGRKVLELGCGTGIFTNMIQKTRADITAIDISPFFIKKAKENTIAKNVKFCIENIEHMSFPDNNFDCIIGSSILHHLDNLEKCLVEIKRVLKKGGVFVFTEPSMMNPHIMVEKNIRFIGKILGDTPSETAFLRWNLAKIFTKAGFSSIFVKPFDFLHPWTPRFLIRVIEKLGLLLEKIPAVKEIAGSLIIYGYK